jgi:transcription elongation factor Elf1
MFERFFERDVTGALKGLTLEWKCPDCAGLNFRILGLGVRNSGEYHTHCRYCKAKFRSLFEKPAAPVEGEAEFLDKLAAEDFSREEQVDMTRDFAEIASLRVDGAPQKVILEKEKLLEQKIDFARRRRR